MNFRYTLQLAIVILCILCTSPQTYAMLNIARSLNMPAMHPVRTAHSHPIEYIHPNDPLLSEKVMANRIQNLESNLNGHRQTLEFYQKHSTALTRRITSLERQRAGLAIWFAATAGTFAAHIYKEEIEHALATIDKMPYAIAEYAGEQKRIMKNRVLSAINTGKHLAKEFIGDDLSLEQPTAETHFATNEAFIFNANPAQPEQRIPWDTLNWN